MGVEVWLYSSFNLGAIWGWVVNATPRPFISWEKSRNALYRRLGGPQGRSGRVRKTSPPPKFDAPTVQPVESLYRLSYPGPPHIAWLCTSCGSRNTQRSASLNRIKSFVLIMDKNVVYYSPGMWLSVAGCTIPDFSKVCFTVTFTCPRTFNPYKWRRQFRSKRWQRSVTS